MQLMNPEDLERPVRAGTFLLLSALFAFLLTSNRIDLLIIHGHSWTIAAAAAFLAILGLNELWWFFTGRRRAQDAATCSHSHSHPHHSHHPQPCDCLSNRIAPKRVKRLCANALIFMAPVLLGFSTTPAVFDASAALHRGLKMNLLSVAPRHPVGSLVELSGFVVRWEELPPNEMAVTRFVVSCCVADAVPVGITVRHPEAAAYPTNSWVHVKGTVQQESRPTLEQGGSEPHFFIQAYLITAIEKPEQPYLCHDH